MKTINILLLATAMLFAFGCGSDFLDEQPQDQVLVENFFTNEQDALLALNAAYQPIRGLFDTNDHQLWDMTTDNASNSSFSGTSIWNVQPGSGGTGNLWTQSFRGISRANIVLDNVPGIEMNEDRKNEILAEARFLRGLYYLGLVTNFGDVPLLLEPIAADNLATSRDPKEKVYEQIIEDLKFAEANLSSVIQLRGTKDLGRATVGAAKGYLARTYLWTKDFDLAAAKAKEIIDSNEYELLDNYGDVFDKDNENNNESIFEAQYKRGFGSGGDAVFAEISCVFSPRGNPQTSCGWGGIVVRGNLVDAYEAGDTERRTATLFTGGDDFFGIPYEPSWSETGHSMKKYIVTSEFSGEGSATSGDGSGVNQHLLRYAEVILTYAEASFQEGNTSEALWGVNQIRERAGLIALDMAALDLDAIYHERHIELALEGHRLNDLRRTEKAAEVLAEFGYDPSIHNVFPIPQSELDANPNKDFGQNFGY